MRLSLLINLSLLLLASAGAGWAQSADDFFNHGAQFYISNNIVQAKATVAEGLKLYPNDIKLKKLDELLKQQNQSQNSQQQNQQNRQNQQNQQQQQKQNQQKSQQNQKDQNAQQDQNQKNQSAQPQADRQKQRAGGQKDQNQAAATQEMSPEDAKRLLDAQKGDEQFLQLKPKGKPENPNKLIKDW